MIPAGKVCISDYLSFIIYISLERLKIKEVFQSFCPALQLNVKEASFLLSLCLICLIIKRCIKWFFKVCVKIKAVKIKGIKLLKQPNSNITIQKNI